MGWFWAILYHLVGEFLFAPAKWILHRVWSCLRWFVGHVCWWRKRREELRGLKLELEALKDYQDQVKAVVPWLGPLFDIRGGETGAIVRGLENLSRIVASCGDAHAQLIIFEIDKLRLPCSPNADIRRKVFQVRGAAASCAPPDSYLSLWTTLVETLEPLLSSDDQDVSNAACVELCENAGRLSRQNSPLLAHLRARVQTLLARCLMADMPEATKIHLVEALAVLRADKAVLKEAFHHATEATLLAPDTLGGALIRLLSHLGSAVYDLDRGDLARLMTSEALFDHHQALYEEHLVPTVFSPFDRTRVRGRVWRRFLVDTVRMSCQPLEGSQRERCECNVGQVSFGGMWCPDCTRSFNLPLGNVELIVGRGDGGRRIQCRVCRVTPPHDNHPARGRGVRIEEYEEEHQEEMYQYLAAMTSSHGQPRESRTERLG